MITVMGSYRDLFYFKKYYQGLIILVPLALMTLSEISIRHTISLFVLSSQYQALAFKLFIIIDYQEPHQFYQKVKI